MSVLYDRDRSDFVATFHSVYFRIACLYPLTFSLDSFDMSEPKSIFNCILQVLQVLYSKTNILS